MSLNGTAVFDLNFRPYLPADRNVPVLDVGCGRGDFLAYLEQNGYRNLRGVEIDPACVAAARMKTRATVDQSSDLEAYLASLPTKYAVITLKSVIAHFPRELTVRYLRAMREALTPDGVLIVETFNASRLTGPYLLYNDVTHHWAYTEYSLREVLERSGLQVLEVSGERLPADRLTTRLFHLAQRAWEQCLRTIYLLERGIGRNPQILSKYVVAVCRPGS